MLESCGTHETLETLELYLMNNEIVCQLLSILQTGCSYVTFQPLRPQDNISRELNEENKGSADTISKEHSAYP
jgi:hypothetical protein